MLNMIRRYHHNVEFIKQEMMQIRYAVGCMEAEKVHKGCEIREFKVFSQWGEDGIIQWLIHNLEIKEKRFIEFGVQNYIESNTRFLLMHDNWDGLIIDGSEENIDFIKHDDIYWRYNLRAVSQFITVDNINTIFKNNGFQGRTGVLSIDIDGNDYWIWEAIECVQPDIVICEYNHRFGKERAVTVPYAPAFVREKAHYSCIYYGASIQAFVALATKKGFSLVAGNSNGNNIFFVRNDLLNDIVKERTVSECFRQGKFRESRNPDGTLAFLTMEEEQKLLEELPVIDVIA